jgi:hypothetical protein
VDKANKNSSGFTTVEVLLALLTLAVVGTAGYFVARHVDNKPQKTSTPVAKLIAPTVPSGPGYLAARQEWLAWPTSSNSGSTVYAPLEYVISDLTNGLKTDKNTSGYASAIKTLGDIVKQPDAMLTPSEQTHINSDIKTLNVFFETNITSPN